MKVEILVAALLSAVWAQEETPSASFTCLYCKKADTMAPFMYTYSYCKSSDYCVEDQWNHYNRLCEEPWIPGYMLDVDADCKAVEKSPDCLTFISSSDMDQQFSNGTLSLESG